MSAAEAIAVLKAAAAGDPTKIDREDLENVIAQIYKDIDLAANIAAAKVIGVPIPDASLNPAGQPDKNPPALLVWWSGNGDPSDAKPIWVGLGAVADGPTPITNLLKAIEDAEPTP